MPVPSLSAGVCSGSFPDRALPPPTATPRPSTAPGFSMNGSQAISTPRAPDSMIPRPATAASDREFRRNAREAGADDFLTKPFDEVELLARVRNSVRIKLYYDGLERERTSLRAAVDGRTQELLAASERLERIHRRRCWAPPGAWR